MRTEKESLEKEIESVNAKKKANQASLMKAIKNLSDRNQSLKADLEAASSKIVASEAEVMKVKSQKADSDRRVLQLEGDNATLRNKLKVEIEVAF